MRLHSESTSAVLPDPTGPPTPIRSTSGFTCNFAFIVLSNCTHDTTRSARVRHGPNDLSCLRALCRCVKLGRPHCIEVSMHTALRRLLPLVALAPALAFAHPS